MTAALSLSADSLTTAGIPCSGPANFLGPGLPQRGIAQFAGPLQRLGHGALWFHQFTDR
jgi:hypothetical protein